MREVVWCVVLVAGSADAGDSGRHNPHHTWTLWGTSLPLLIASSSATRAGRCAIAAAGAKRLARLLVVVGTAPFGRCPVLAIMQRRALAEVWVSGSGPGG